MQEKDAETKSIGGDTIHVKRSLQWHVKELVMGSGKAERTILRDIYGQASDGTFTIILGPSGAGKTSLLECLSLRIRSFKGVVLLDDAVPSPDYFSTAAFVYQQELLPGYLTAREHLMFHATARMTKSFSKEAIKQRVEDVIAETGLVTCADTIMGGYGPTSTVKGISGGERKRVSLAVELLQCPAIIFLDEPCSGLDSVMSESVVTTLSQLASSGRIVMASLHSPSSDAMALMTHVVLLTWDGRLAYQGTRAEVLEHFQSIGYVYPKDVNPADYLLKIVAAREREPLDQEAVRMDSLVKRFQGSPMGKAAQQSQGQLAPVDMRQVSLPHQPRHASFWTCFTLNNWRLFQQMRREIGIVLLMGLGTVLVGVLFGLLYYQIGLTSWRNIMGVHFSLVVATTCLLPIIVVVQIPFTYAMLKREVLSGVNSVAPFVICNFLSFWWWAIVLLLQSTVIYWMAGLAVDWQVFMNFCMINVIVGAAALSIGVMAGCVSTDVTTCLVVVPTFTVPMVLFAGVLCDRRLVPSWMAWIEYISLVNYGFSALIINVSGSLPPNVASLLLNYLEVDPKDYDFNIIMLVVLCIGLQVGAYIALKLRFAAYDSSAV